MVAERTKLPEYTAPFERKAKWAEIWAVVGMILALGLTILLSKYKFDWSFAAPGEVLSENVIRIALPEKQIGRIKTGDEVELYLQHPDVQDSLESPFYGRVIELRKEDPTSEHEATYNTLIQLSSTRATDLHKLGSGLTARIVTDSKTLIKMLFEKI